MTYLFILLNRNLGKRINIYIYILTDNNMNNIYKYICIIYINCK